MYCVTAVYQRPSIHIQRCVYTTMRQLLALLLAVFTSGEVFEGNLFSVNSWRPIARFVSRLSWTRCSFSLPYPLTSTLLFCTYAQPHTHGRRIRCTHPADA